MSKTSTRPDGDKLDRQPFDRLPLTRTNFILMACAGVVIILGFLLMLGGGNDSGVFNPEIFSTRRVVVGPTIAFLGFIFMGVAIMWPQKKTK